ncbi:MAG: rRNA pseudouridine synthase [Clostridia bacterium]|nr:rRNA pseudouridine synthase [Clostridia bacterium]
MVRLQKFISECGYTSRRKAEEMILNKRVKVNGVIAELGVKVDELTDRVEIDGKLIKKEDEKVYIMINKPTGYLSSVSDDRGRKTVVDLLNIKERVFPVGRLDYDTEGLLILTNDGEFTYKVTHPKFEITKTYVATLNKNLIKEDKQKLLDGVTIEDYIAIASVIEEINEEKKEVLITISQGKNRQVRKMFESVGYKVLKLKRISIGNLMLGSLKRGEWKKLSQKELDRIFSEKCKKNY